LGSISSRVLLAFHNPAHLARVAIVFKASTLLNFHRTLVRRKQFPSELTQAIERTFAENNVGP
jgi:hypothetical protein